MAHPSKRTIEYIDRMETMQWDDLHALWRAIQVGDLPDWEPGKALEHLVVRAFRLSGLEAEYPYDVPPGGPPFEQIDGIAYWDSLAFLIECKDTRHEDIESIAKLRSQLERRPGTVLGMMVMTGAFTLPARKLAMLMVPYRFMVWQSHDIGSALSARDFRPALRRKYLNLCRYGLLDWTPFWQDLRVDGGGQ
jgi:hypothetical protein